MRPKKDLDFRRINLFKNSKGYAQLHNFYQHFEYKFMYFDIFNETFHFEDVQQTNGYDNACQESLDTYFKTKNNDDLPSSYKNIPSHKTFRKDFIKNVVYWPSYFMFWGMYYYAIYTQPHVLQEHCRKYDVSDDFKSDYYRELDICAQDLFMPHTLVEKLSQYAFKTDNSEQRAQYFKYIWDDILIYRLGAFDHLFKVSTLYEGEKAKINRLHHLDKNENCYVYPVFYTSCALELTVPIAQAVESLSRQTNRAFEAVHKALGFVFNVMIGTYKSKVNQRLREIDMELSPYYRAVRDKSCEDFAYLAKWEGKREEITIPFEYFKGEAHKILSKLSNADTDCYEDIYNNYVSKNECLLLMYQLNKIDVKNLDFDQLMFLNEQLAKQI